MKKTFLGGVAAIIAGAMGVSAGTATDVLAAPAPEPAPKPVKRAKKAHKGPPEGYVAKTAHNPHYKRSTNAERRIARMFSPQTRAADPVPMTRQVRRQNERIDAKGQRGLLGLA